MRPRRALTKKLKKLNETSPSIRQYIISEFLDENNDAVIHLCIRDCEELYDPFSYGNQYVLNNDIMDYIDQKAYSIPLSYAIRLNFVGDLNYEEQSKIVRLVREHYHRRLLYKKRDIRLINYKIIGLIVIGILFLSAYFYLEFVSAGAIFTEIISIIGSVSMWEAAYSYLLEKTEEKINYLKVGQLATAKVSFIMEQS